MPPLLFVLPTSTTTATTTWRAGGVLLLASPLFLLAPNGYIPEATLVVAGSSSLGRAVAYRITPHPVAAPGPRPPPNRRTDRRASRSSRHVGARRRPSTCRPPRPARRPPPPRDPSSSGSPCVVSTTSVSLLCFVFLVWGTPGLSGGAWTASAARRASKRGGSMCAHTSLPRFVVARSSRAAHVVTLPSLF